MKSDACTRSPTLRIMLMIRLLLRLAQTRIRKHSTVIKSSMLKKLNTVLIIKLLRYQFTVAVNMHRSLFIKTFKYTTRSETQMGLACRLQSA